MQPVTRHNEEALLHNKRSQAKKVRRSIYAVWVCGEWPVWCITSTWTWAPSNTCLFVHFQLVGLQQTVNTLHTLDGYFMFPQTLPLTVIALKCHSYYHWIDHVWVTFALERLHNCCNFSCWKPIFLKLPLLLSCTLCCRLVLIAASASRAGVHTKPPTGSLMFASVDQRC